MSISIEEILKTSETPRETLDSLKSFLQDSNEEASVLGKSKETKLSLGVGERAVFQWPAKTPDGKENTGNPEWSVWVTVKTPDGVKKKKLVAPPDNRAEIDQNPEYIEFKKTPEGEKVWPKLRRNIFIYQITPEGIKEKMFDLTPKAWKSLLEASTDPIENAEHRNTFLVKREETSYVFKVATDSTVKGAAVKT